MRNVIKNVYFYFVFHEFPDKNSKESGIVVWGNIQATQISAVVDEKLLNCI